jgi:hypothetical protein
MEEKVPIADYILEEAGKQNRKILYLARNVHYQYKTLRMKLKQEYKDGQEHIDTDLLIRLSKLLKYDFFAYYSAFLEALDFPVIRETNISGKEKPVIMNLIKEKLKEQERSVAWLADEVGYKHSRLYKIMNREKYSDKGEYIDTDLLFDISKVLRCDFFAHYSAFLKKQL